MISGKIIWKILQAFTNFVLQCTFMKDKLEQDLAQIRNMMEQSTRFISLSVTSGISAGIIALAGAAVPITCSINQASTVLTGKKTCIHRNW